MKHLSWFVLLGLLASCGEPSEPTFNNGVFVVSGAGQTDTIGARLRQPIVMVRYRDDRGALAGDTIRFVAGNASIVTDSGLKSFTSVVTDQNGRAQVLVQLGCREGDAVVSATSTGSFSSAIAELTVRRGRTVRTESAPNDTAVRIGGALQLRTNEYDRCNNPAEVTAEYASSSSAVRVTPSGLVTGLSFGQAQIVARVGSAVDTTYVAVVPDGSILALLEFPRISGVRIAPATVDLDGGNREEIPSPSLSETGTVTRTRDGSLIAYYSGQFVGNRVFIRTSDGTLRPLPADSTVRGRIPAISPDGNWVYFTAPAQGFSGFALWRARTDGADLEQLTPAGEFGGPSFSPDGNQVAFIAADGRFADGPVSIFNVNTRSVTQLPLIARAVRWSPNGDQLGLVSNNAVVVARTDGSEPRVISPPGKFYGGKFLGTPTSLSWSADGKYLVVQASTGYAMRRSWLDIIEVATGVTVPLTFFVRWTPESPVWFR
ncbi:MAG TPA: hypothetical protein VGD49_01490 [Longimicrobiales bacterium]